MESTTSTVEREQYARRLVFTAMLGLVFPPIAFYAIYLLLNAAFGEGNLSNRGKFNLFLGSLMTLAALLWFTIFLGIPYIWMIAF